MYPIKTTPKTNIKTIIMSVIKTRDMDPYKTKNIKNVYHN